MGTTPETHWRPLGQMLIDRGLLTEGELECALRVQQETEQPLGEILVDHQYVSIQALSKVLAEQHGLAIQSAAAARERRLAVPPPAGPSAVDPTWRPLGELLVERGLLSEGGLHRALIEQKRSGQLLGEILVARGWVSPLDLTRTLAEQRGLDFTPKAAAESGKREESFEVHVSGRGLVQTSATFLDAADAAFEEIEREDPEWAEVVHLCDGERSSIWSYSREAAEATARERDPAGPFGFPVWAWQPSRRAAGGAAA
jgi:hypothetical protein